MNQPSVPPQETSGWLQGRLKNSPRLIPDTLWTLVNNFLTVASGLVIFKIISHWIAAGDYGQASLVLGAVGLLNQMIASPSVLAHMRLYFGHAKEGHGDAYASAVLRLLVLTACAMSAIYLLISLVYRMTGDLVYWALAAPAILLLFTQAQLSAALGFLEVKKQYRALTIAQSLSKVMQVPALLALIYFSVKHSASVVYSQALAGGFVVLFWSVLPAMKQPKDDTARFSAREISRAASHVFGWSLYLFNFFSWILATSDRYIIEHFWSTREVGIYALNYGLWSVPFLSMNAWLEQLVRARLYERAEAGDRKRMLALAFQRLGLTLALGAALTAVIYFIGRPIAILVIGEHYWFSKELMMVICVAHLFYALAASLHVVFHAVKRTQSLMWIAIVTSVCNFGANLVLVPKMGIVGAAWSTLGGYLVMFVVTMIVAWSVLGRGEGSGSPNEIG